MGLGGAVERRVLVLFDVDATLISTSGAGMRAMEDAGRELLSPEFSTEGIAFAGRLDPLIVTDMFRKCGVEETPEVKRAFRGAYGRHLARRLADHATVARSLPGVPELLGALLGDGRIATGVLTGNFAETGRMKLARCGIDAERFHLHVWGDESASDPPRREDLPGVALERYEKKYGRGIDPSRVVVIGDTPHDVSCARAHGCRSLGVATGSFGAAELRACGATGVVEDLSDTGSVVAWLWGAQGG
jgi:phosphoglycolate phosphatase